MPVKIKAVGAAFPPLFGVFTHPREYFDQSSIKCPRGLPIKLQLISLARNNTFALGLIGCDGGWRWLDQHQTPIPVDEKQCIVFHGAQSIADARNNRDSAR